MKRQSAQSGHDFIKWQRDPATVEYENRQFWHRHIHRVQLAFDLIVVGVLLLLAFGSRNA